MIIDRTKAPAIKLPQGISPLDVRKVTLQNGMPMYISDKSKADIVRLTFVFDAGSRYQQQKFVALATAELLCEGTEKHSADEIADALEFFDSSISVQVDRDWSFVSIYTLSKHLEKTLEIAEELIKTPTFPIDRLQTYAQTSKQDLSIKLAALPNISRRLFEGAIYGKTHHYGMVGQPDDFDKLTPELLKNFHADFYSSANTYLVAAGKVNDDTISKIEHFFGKNPWGKQKSAQSEMLQVGASQEKFIYESKDDCLQTSIRIGRVLFPKNHADYNAVSVTLAMLGGYFGSRLMKNIREDKGYTYGIYAGVSNMRDSSNFCIATEVGNDYVHQTLDEIKKEILRLQNEKITKDELSLVQNYIAGSMLRSVDGAWNIADLCIDIKNYKLGNSYLTNAFDELMNITPERIIEMANKYLKIEELTQVIVGRY